MTEMVGKQLGNFFGKFVMYDPSNNTSIWREYMRLKIKVDVRSPLKRKKKILKRDKTEFVVNCKYEKLGDFCYVCGLLTHTERFCKRRLKNGSSFLVREWGRWLKAPPRQLAMQGRSRWLRDERNDDWGEKSRIAKSEEFQKPIFQQSGVTKARKF